MEPPDTMSGETSPRAETSARGTGPAGLAGDPNGSVRADPAATERPLIAYALPDEVHVPLVPAPAARQWMRETDGQFANRCLPLLMANQGGWCLLNPEAFQASWDGGDTRGALTIEYPGKLPAKSAVVSMFGHGILTWQVGYLFRTPPGYNLAVGGVTNMPKDGIHPLAGVVETDWAVATFTMNWKFTRPHHPVSFAAGEPFCMIIPQRRHELEEFDPRVVPIEHEPELATQWDTWSSRRELMNGLIGLAYRLGPERVKHIPYERHYFEGTSPGGWGASEHQKKLSLKPFRRTGETSDPTHRYP